jgi:hypothetical protein
MAETETKRIGVALALLASVVGLLLAKPATPEGGQFYGAAIASASSVSARASEHDGR